MDLQRVSENEAIRVHVPLHFINEEACVGVKLGGGMISHQLVEVELECLPKDLPEFIEVDVAGLNVGDSIHLSGVRLPAGVSIVALTHGAEHDLPVVSVIRADRGCCGGGGRGPRGRPRRRGLRAPGATAGSDPIQLIAGLGNPGPGMTGPGTMPGSGLWTPWRAVTAECSGRNKFAGETAASHWTPMSCGCSSRRPS
jgi:hypothetical protein